MTTQTEKDTWDRVHGIPIYQRGEIWYADFRQYQDARHESLGTRNREEAEEALYQRKQELEAAEDRRQAAADEDPLLKDFVEEHLDLRRDEVAKKTWVEDKRTLERNLLPFIQRKVGKDAHLSDVSARLLKRYLKWRSQDVKASTANRDLATISSLLKRAHNWGYVTRNEARHVTRLETEKPDHVWLEVEEAARVLEAAKAMEQDGRSRCYPHLHALLATFLLTGGRRSEVLGLERDDVDLENEYIHIRPNRWNEGLKTDHSDRTVPLWPQLKKILAGHLDAREDGHPLLFPLHWDEGKDHDSRMLNNIRSSLRSVEKRAELEKHLTPVVFRHTYTATRLQTTDNGAPVSIFTVARELGHRGIDRIEDTYGHLQRKRERLEEVYY